MQNTRLNNLLDRASDQTFQAIINPWRRISLIIISFFFGFFGGSAISSTAGQKAVLDIGAAAAVTLVIEITSRIIYSQQPRLRSSTNTRPTFILDVLNSLKVGIMYGLFLEAFKLNS